MVIYAKSICKHTMLMLACITSPERTRLTVFEVILVFTSESGLSRLEEFKEGTSVIHLVKKWIYRRTEQVWRATFNPQHTSCESDSRVIKMSEAIQLINGRDKPLLMFLSRWDSEAVHTLFNAEISKEKRPAARRSTNESVYVVCVSAQPHLDLWMSQMFRDAHSSSSSSEYGINTEIWQLKSNHGWNTMCY